MYEKGIILFDVQFFQVNMKPNNKLCLTIHCLLDMSELSSHRSMLLKNNQIHPQVFVCFVCNSGRLVVMFSFSTDNPVILRLRHSDRHWITTLL